MNASYKWQKFHTLVYCRANLGYHTFENRIITFTSATRRAEQTQSLSRDLRIELHYTHVMQARTDLNLRQTRNKNTNLQAHSFESVAYEAKHGM